MMCSFVRLRKATKAGLLGLSFLFSLALQAQDDGFKAVPILTGSTAYFTRVTAGQYQDAPTVSPLLLLPLGDKRQQQKRTHRGRVLVLAGGDTGKIGGRASQDGNGFKPVILGLQRKRK